MLTCAIGATGWCVNGCSFQALSRSSGTTASPKKTGSPQSSVARERQLSTSPVTAVFYRNFIKDCLILLSFLNVLSQINGWFRLFGDMWASSLWETQSLWNLLLLGLSQNGHASGQNQPQEWAEARPLPSFPLLSSSTVDSLEGLLD